jgi:DtxR family Mn-dependent transcriptional regulator
LRRWRRGSSKDSEAHHSAKLEPRFDETVDEILELAWLIEEEGSHSLSELAACAGDDFEVQLEAARTAGTLKSTDDGKFEITSIGRERAREVTRRHRLAETLLTQILEMDESQAESDACRFEHILSPEATDSVCTLLGHPPTCPHGKPIPRGRCCEVFRKELSPLVMPLSDVSPGEMTRIVFITPKSHARLDKLASLGIVPGRRIRLHQKRPTCIIQIGETEIAIDGNVAQEIFVKRV